MRNNFRQGLISYQKDGTGQPQFLLPSSLTGYVSLNVAPTPMLVSFAHGSSNYLQAFDVSVPNAWGPLVSGHANYLYWDIDLLTSNVSYGITTLEPIVSNAAPAPQVEGQMWFDLSTTTMKVWSVVGNKWISVVRVLAGLVPNGTTNSIIPKIGGSQVGLNVDAVAGFIMLDSQLMPLRTSLEEFLTTDTPVRIKNTIGTSGVLAVPPNAFIPVRAGQNIPAMSLVYFSSDDTVSLASSDPALIGFRTPVGIIQDALAANEVGVITQSGDITYDQWDWTGFVGKPLYSDSNGAITTTRPAGLLAYRIGFVKNKNTILFNVDAETNPQVYSATESQVIIAGTTPVSAVDTINSIGERVITISLPPATRTSGGYMTSAYASAVEGISARFTADEADIAGLHTSKANTVHTHVAADITDLAGILALKMDADHIFDDRYSLLSHNHDGRYALLAHTHVIPEVLGLQEALNAKASRALGLLPFNRVFEGVDQTGMNDVGTGMSLVDALNAKSALVHTHAVSDIIGLQDDLDAKAFVNHTQSISTITGLQSALDSKMQNDRVFSLSTLSDVVLTNLSTNQSLIFNGTSWINQTPSSAGSTGGGAQVQHDAISNLTDVNFATPPNQNDVLTFNGTSWYSAPLTSSSSLIAGQGITIQNGVISVTDYGSGGTGTGGTGTGGTGTGGTGTGGTSAPSSNSSGVEYSIQMSDGQGRFVGLALGLEGEIFTAHGINPPTWEPPIVSGGTVTSVGLSGADTGLTFDLDKITTAGKFKMGGVLAITSGGTGATNATAAITNLLPPQDSSTVGAALVSNGTSPPTWVVQPGSAYSAGTGLILNGTVFNSTVADNTGDAYRVTVSKGDGTLQNLTAGTAGYILTSSGPSAAPTWQNVSGTVSDIAIYNDPTMGLQISGGDPYSPAQTYSKHITETGQISLTGTLSLLHGGTGATTGQIARKNLLPVWPTTVGPRFVLTAGTSDVSWQSAFPDQAGQAGKFLSTDGTEPHWVFPDTSGTVTSIDISGGTTGLTTSGGPIIDNGTITLGGVLKAVNGGTGGMLPIQYGGTGAITAFAAINALVPAQGGNVGKILTTDGTSVSWTSASAGSVTSIDIEPASTGLIFSGGPITQAGKFVVGGVLSPNNGGTGGVLPINHGGTGATSVKDAIGNLLPDQTGKSGYILSTDGFNLSWGTAAGTVQDVDGSAIGLNFAHNSYNTGILVATGVIPIASGGTGRTTQADAINALVPAQSGQGGKILSTDGSFVSWTSASAGSVTSIDVFGSTTGLVFSGGPITQAGTITMGGVLSLQNGGTGASSATTALNNILPDQSTSAGQFLTTNGTKVVWSTLPTANAVTSINVSGGVTGLTTTGGPVTSSGTITLTGTLAITNGGTGSTTPTTALTALLPSQTGQSGKVLSSSGTAASWVAASTLVSAAGATTQVQFNSGGIFAGSAAFTYASNTLTVPSIATTTTVDLAGSIRCSVSAVSASALDCSISNYFTKTAAGANTWTFTNVPTGRMFILILALKSGGSGVQSWPTSVVWPNGQAPTLSGSATDELVFCTDNGGTSWRGSYSIGFTA